MKRRDLLWLSGMVWIAFGMAHNKLLLVVIGLVQVVLSRRKDRSPE